MFAGEMLKQIPKCKGKAVMPAITASTQHRGEGPSNCNKIRKRNV